MNPSRFIFDENLIREKLLPLNSSSRLVLEDDCFIKSAILFLIIPHADNPYDLVLIRRTKNDKDKHSGEMGFPGGVVDAKDSSLEETALRECEEELGIPRGNITILGSFDDHITPQRFIITPVVGYIKPEQKMVKEEKEVDEIVNIPISFFADKKKYRGRNYLLDGDPIEVGKYNFRSKEGKKYVIFGATSHIIVHFIQTVYPIQLMKPGARRLNCEDMEKRLTQKFVNDVKRSFISEE